MLKIGIMTVPKDFFLSASSIYREVLIGDFLRATSKHYSFDILNTLLILLFNTLFTGSKKDTGRTQHIIPHTGSLSG